MKKLNYHITDTEGRIIDTYSNEKEETTSLKIPLEKLEQGVYNLVIIDENNTSSVRFLKQ